MIESIFNFLLMIVLCMGHVAMWCVLVGLVVGPIIAGILAIIDCVRGTNCSAG
jgi:hypothetical protein